MSHPSETLLLRTGAGAYLSGTATKESPMQVWEIYDQLHCRHLARQRLDPTGCHILMLGLRTWLRLCRNGTPDALDIMFAPAEHTTYDLLQGLRGDYQVMETATADTAFRQAAADDPTRAGMYRHNLDELHRWGRYDPTEWARLQHAQHALEAAA